MQRLYMRAESEHNMAYYVYMPCIQHAVIPVVLHAILAHALWLLADAA